MPLSPGDQLGHYKIQSMIGKGGMGEVYRALDTKLERDVAIKVLPHLLSENPERLARFEREAKVLASLNHPNIASIYGVEGGVENRALVMELVPGPTLEDRIKQGPIPAMEAEEILLQIAEAIEYAHDKGVIHRDLKPANIKIDPEDKVKILDFGLAKALADPMASSGIDVDPNNSPTITMGGTIAGTILGTAAYMAPEQARGKKVDKRADIWAFGVVVWEMLTGERLFQGEDTVQVLSKVLEQKPDLDRVPVKFRTLLARCLDRNVKDRLRDIGETRFLLRTEESAPGLGPAVAPPPRVRWIPWVLSGILLVALAASLAWIFKPSPPLAITRFPFALGEGQAFTNNGRPILAISPDGTQMVYVANTRLYLRSMAELEAHEISGTNSGGAVANPVFSPDGKSVAYSELTERTIKRISVSGGAAATICSMEGLNPGDKGGPVGISWGADGIVFALPGKGILRVSPDDGKPEPLVVAKADEVMIAPQMLPGGQAVLFTIASTNGTSDGQVAWDKAQIVVQALKSGVRKVVLKGGSDARYLATGHLVYALGGVLFAVPFDAKRLETTGGPVGIVEGVARGNNGVAQFAFSSTGSMIYVPGPVVSGAPGQDVLGFIDRMSEVEPLKVPPASYFTPRLSHDGKRVTYYIEDGKDVSVWIYDLSGASAARRLTLPGEGANRYPILSPDGQRVAFQSDREGDLAIWWQRADGSGLAERLTKPDKGTSHLPDSWAPDGQTFSFSESKVGDGAAVWTYSLRDKKATVFASAPGGVFNSSTFSPDGHWVAYQSLRGASQPAQIYVRPFPLTAAVYIAPSPSQGGTHHPMWSPDGKELFYASRPGEVGSMSFTTQPSVSFGAPVRFPNQFSAGSPLRVRPYDVLPDGKRFIRVLPTGSTAPSAAGPPQIRVVLNWFEDVRSRAEGK